MCHPGEKISSQWEELDKDTEGLLLITNDGELAHRLLAPRRHVPKQYFAQIKGKMTQEDAQKFRQGVEIGEKVRRFQLSWRFSL